MHDNLRMINIKCYCTLCESVNTFVVVCYREELATLQRQVDGLGRSLQPTHSTAPSTYQGIYYTENTLQSD